MVINKFLKLKKGFNPCKNVNKLKCINSYHDHVDFLVISLK